MDKVRALIAAIGASFVLALPVAAAQPERVPFEFEYSVDAPAGEVCDFDYHEEGFGSGWDEIFVDQNGDFVRDTGHGTVTVLHENAETGYVLTETVTSSSRFTDETFDFAGLNWKLRDESGRIVAVHAGHLSLTFGEDEVLATPNLGADFRETICPLLGGNPA